MRKTMFGAGIGAALLLSLAGALATPLSAETLDGTQTYDLLFREGTLGPVTEGAALRYDRAVVNTLKPEAATRDTGTIILSLNKEQAAMVELEFQRDDGKHRGLGSFPASVGNPMIMYFYESVIRDMAEAAGGSPFYIRNRVKESLVQPTEAESGEAQVNGETVATQIVRLHPFATDPNRDRMQGFGALELEVTMSDAVPGWYVSLVASVPGEDGPVYRSEIGFDKLGDME